MHFMNKHNSLPGYSTFKHKPSEPKPLIRIGWLQKCDNFFQKLESFQFGELLKYR